MNAVVIEMLDVDAPRGWRVLGAVTPTVLPGSITVGPEVPPIIFGWIDGEPGAWRPVGEFAAAEVDALRVIGLDELISVGSIDGEGYAFAYLDAHGDERRLRIRRLRDSPDDSPGD